MFYCCVTSIIRYQPFINLYQPHQPISTPINRINKIIIMKKLFLSILLLSPIVSLLAQENELKNVVGGRINLLLLNGATYNNGQVTHTGFESDKVRLIDLQPYAAWAVSKRTLLGFELGVNRTHSITTSKFLEPFQSNTYWSSYTAGIFTRHYLRPQARFGLFLEPTLGFSFSKQKEEDSGGNKFDIYKQNQMQLSAAPGLAYQISERLGLLLRIGSVGYLHSALQYDGYDKQTSNGFQFNFSFTSIAWGVEYRWEKKEKATAPQN